MKNNCSNVKRKFKPQNLNFQLNVETLFIADINYLFIYFSLLKLDLHVVKKFVTNKNDKINKKTIKFDKRIQANQLKEILKEIFSDSLKDFYVNSFFKMAHNKDNTCLSKVRLTTLTKEIFREEFEKQQKNLLNLIRGNLEITMKEIK